MGAPALAAFIGAFKYGKVQKVDAGVAIVGGVGLSLFLLPIDPKLPFMIFAFAIVIPLSDQIRKLYATGKKGVVSGELITTFVVKNFFYTIFAFTLPGKEPVLQICAPIWLGLSIWLLGKWIVSPR